MTIYFNTNITILIYIFWNTVSVAFNGFWAPWGPWEGCSGSCGSGEQKRSRVCVGPENGGENCVGNVNEEKRLCGLKYCDSCE